MRLVAAIFQVGKGHLVEQTEQRRHPRHDLQACVGNGAVALSHQIQRQRRHNRWFIVVVRRSPLVVARRQIRVAHGCANLRLEADGVLVRDDGWTLKAGITAGLHEAGEEFRVGCAYAGALEQAEHRLSRPAGLQLQGVYRLCAIDRSGFSESARWNASSASA